MAAGEGVAYLRRLGRLQVEFDLLIYIGYKTLAYDLTMVTRNVRHFADVLGLEDWLDLAVDVVEST